MIRTLIGIICIIVAVLWLPVWFQLLLFVAGIFFLRYRLWLLVPAVISDALYAPTHSFVLTHFKTTLVVGVMLVVWYILMTQTRLGEYYETAKK